MDAGKTVHQQWAPLRQAPPITVVTAPTTMDAIRTPTVPGSARSNMPIERAATDNLAFTAKAEGNDPVAKTALPCRAPVAGQWPVVDHRHSIMIRTALLQFTFCELATTNKIGISAITPNDAAEIARVTDVLRC